MVTDGDQPDTLGAQEGPEGDKHHCKPVVIVVGILRCFSGEKAALGVIDIASTLNLSRPAVHRYLATLMHWGYVEQVSSRRYRLAAAAADVGLAWLNCSPLRYGVREALCDLRERVGYTTSLAVLDGDEIVYLDRRLGCQPGQHAVDARLSIGARLPAHCTAAGKVLLASLPPAVRDELLAGLALTRQGPNTIVTKEELNRDLRQVLIEGYAVSDQEIPDTRSIAATVTDARGNVVAAIEVTGPADAISPDALAGSFSTPVRTTAMQILIPAHDSPEPTVYSESEETRWTPALQPGARKVSRGHLADPRYSKSAERGLAVLACFTAARPLLDASDIADQLGMSRSGVRLHIDTLEALGCLERVAGCRYRLAPAVTQLGMSALASTTFEEHASPYMLELCDAFSCITSLSVLDGPEILYLERLYSIRGAHASDGLHPGSRLPAQDTTMGRLLLAYLPRKEQDRFIAGLPSKTASTSKPNLREELRQIRGHGIAADVELTPDERAVAAPVHSCNGEVVAALNIVLHTPAVSIADLREHLAPALIATAGRISARLGYRPTDERSNGHARGAPR